MRANWLKTATTTDLSTDQGRGPSLHHGAGRVRTSARYRWWNAYWVILRKAKNLGLAGKKVLVVGCGFGDDAVQLAYLGASISAVDISAESVAIAQKRAHASAAIVDFAVSSAERLPYADETFDLVYLPDVVHHLDIPAAIHEVRRVLKPTGVVLGNEPLIPILGSRQSGNRASCAS